MHVYTSKFQILPPLANHLIVAYMRLLPLRNFQRSETLNSHSEQSTGKAQIDCWNIVYRDCDVHTCLTSFFFNSALAEAYFPTIIIIISYKIRVYPFVDIVQFWCVIQVRMFSTYCVSHTVNYFFAKLTGLPVYIRNQSCTFYLVNERLSSSALSPLLYPPLSTIVSGPSGHLEQ